MSFVHLHTHSEYSLLDGANRIPDLVAHVKKLGMESLAVTDHGNLHAAWTFYEHARAQQIRPILGFEAYLAFGSRTLREKPSWAPAPYSHLVLLAKSRTGYHNLVRLTSIGFVEGFYRRPRIDKDVLAEHSEGLVCLAACLSGEIALYLRQGKYDEARRSAEWFSRTFGPNGFWLEIQQHGIPEERQVTEGMLRLGQELGVGVVATNDAHYLRREDAESHDVLLAIGTGSDLDDPKRFRFLGQESYVKSEAEMRAMFPDSPESLANTTTVANLCEFDFEKRYFLPTFPRPAEYSSDEALLDQLATRGAELRYGTPLPAAVRDRLSYELGVIEKAGYAGYFLIVQDFIAAARERGIPVGPGRGSAAGSLVAYSLGITDVCPLRFDLLFERFLNPERVSMPDIDVDFCFERRGEVIEYVRERYGRTSVGQIVTFGTMKARAAVKDVARVLRIPPGEADRITKLIPSGPAYSLNIRDAEKKIDELRDLVRGNPVYRRLVDLSSRIEGISRHMSVHAAGVVIAPGPLSEYVPVCTAPTKGAGASGEGEESIITQYEMGALEKVGMLKMDMLGLKTLTVIHDTLAMLRARDGSAPDMKQLELDDPAVYELLRQGRTAGIFQFESPLATDTLRAMRCDRFDDLVASNALLRPGPLDAGMHTVFIRRKLGLEKVTYPHPLLQEILEPTYGVITYQEQVMRIANVLAGFTLAEADVLRKAVGKKDQELANREVAKFVERAVATGHPRAMVEELGRQIVTFGRYGFNKSHSVAYSVLSYQTAWLKAHHPAEFMAALLSSEIGNTDKVVQYINEARELGLDILPPDVNESGFKFTVVGERRIRFGLGAVRNVGEGAINSIIAGRETGAYTSITDLVQRIDLRLCNKRVLESLVAAGACDSLGGHRKQLIEVLEPALSEAQLLQAEREAGQGSLFEESGSGGQNGARATSEDKSFHPTLPEIPSWTEAERLAKEKEVLGFFISGHPLERFREEVELFGSRTTATLDRWSEHQVNVAAVVTAVKRQISKKTGKEYARLVLEDFHGTAEAIVFPEAWAKLNQIIQPDAALLLTGGYSERDRGEDQAPFIVEGAGALEELKSSGALALSLRWKAPAAPPPNALKEVAALCSAHPGPTPLYIEWSDGNGEAVRLRSRRIRVTAEDDLIRALRTLLGSGSVHYVKAG
jgi:DNA polymerase-3 subunit alpha